MKDKDLKKLPKADVEKIIKCPHCGWYGNNNNDITATFHESLSIEETDKGTEYYHCTCCGNDFRKEN